MAAAVILSCSPRKNGNCDAAAGIFARESGLDAAGAELLFFRDWHVAPCVSCGWCTRHPGSPCPLDSRDDARILLQKIWAAPLVCIVAPVYFYGVPAQFKALIDRSQALWAAGDAGLGLPGFTPPELGEGGGSGWTILTAARSRGDKLFEGSLLTLRCWLRALGKAPADPLCLYGLDGPADLRGSAVAQAAVQNYAREAAAGPGPDTAA